MWHIFPPDFVRNRTLQLAQPGELPAKDPGCGILEPIPSLMEQESPDDSQGEHADSTQRDPSQPLDLNPGPSCCEVIVLTTLTFRQISSNYHQALLIRCIVE